MATDTQLKASTISLGGSKCAFVIGGKKSTKARAWNILRTMKFSWNGSMCWIASKPLARIMAR